MAKTTLTTFPQLTKVYWKRIVIGILLLAVVASVGYYFAFARLYKNDYSQMLSGVNSSTTAYNELLAARDNAIGALAGESEAFTKTVNEYRQKSTTYQSSVASLATERALRDKEIQIKYDALMARDRKFDNFVSGQLTLLPLVHGVTVSCNESAPSKLNISDLGGVVAAYDAAFKPCTEAMKALVGSTNETAAKRATDSVAYFDTMRSHAVAMQDAYGAGNRAAFESEYNAFLEALAQYKTHIQVSNLLDIDKSVVPTDELNALAKILSDSQK